MLFKKRFWPGLGDGTITVAFRRWKKPTVKAGGTLRSPVGLLAIEAVEPCSLASISAAQAGAAGYESKAELLRALAERTGTLYRVSFSKGGADPRDALARDDSLSDEDRERIETTLARSDARSLTGAWTTKTLKLIAKHPGRRAGDLAPKFDLPLREFKTRVRRLKSLGLTESLKVGYRLSPRGKAFLRL